MISIGQIETFLKKDEVFEKNALSEIVPQLSNEIAQNYAELNLHIRPPLLRSQSKEWGKLKRIFIFTDFLTKNHYIMWCSIIFCRKLIGIKIIGNVFRKTKFEKKRNLTLTIQNFISNLNKVFK